MLCKTSQNMYNLPNWCCFRAMGGSIMSSWTMASKKLYDVEIFLSFWVKKNTYAIFWWDLPESKRFRENGLESPILWLKVVNELTWLALDLCLGQKSEGRQTSAPRNQLKSIECQGETFFYLISISLRMSLWSACCLESDALCGNTVHTFALSN